MTQDDQDRSDAAGNDTTHAKAASEDDAWSVAVADGPANEVGVSLVPERPLHRPTHVAESWRVSGVCESV